MNKLIINDGRDGLTAVILWVCDRLSRGGGGGGEEKCGCANKPLQWFLRSFDAENFSYSPNPT